MATSVNSSVPGPAGKGAPAARVSTRNLILKAARELFNREGYDGTSIATICDRIGIMVGNLTYYFPKKRDIVLALKDEFDAEIGSLERNLLTELLAGETTVSPAETHRLLRSMLIIIWEHRFFFTSVMSLNRLDPRIVAAFREVEQGARIGLTQLVERGVGDAVIRLSDHPGAATALADNIWYLMWGCMFFQKARDVGLEPSRDAVIDTCLLQLGALFQPLVPPDFIASYRDEVLRAHLPSDEGEHRQ